MKYEIIRWTVNWYHIGDVIEMDEKLAKAYGEKYLKPIIDKTETKEQKEIQNKALSSKEVKTKWQGKN